MWVFPKIVVLQNGWFIVENPIKMDDLRETPLFLETPKKTHFGCGGASMNDSTAFLSQQTPQNPTVTCHLLRWLPKVSSEDQQDGPTKSHPK